MRIDNYSKLEMAQMLASTMSDIERDIVKRTKKLMKDAKERGVEPEKIVKLESQLLAVLNKRISKFIEVEYGTHEIKREKDGSVKVVCHPSKKQQEKQEEFKRINKEYLEKLKPSHEYYLKKIEAYDKEQNQTETLGK